MTEKSKKQPPQSVLLLKLARSAYLFHTPEREAYATIAVGDHEETWAVRSDELALWLARCFYQRQGRPPSKRALQEVVATLEGKALFDGPTERVYVRLAEHDGRVYLDLCNDEWEVVEISSSGWCVKSSSPVRFRRTKGMLPLPPPARGGSIEELRPFVNVARDEDFVLIVAFVVAALRPTGPYPVLNLTGEQGSAKSTAQRFLRALVDPSTAPLRALPSDVRDLAVAANNSSILVFDNLSRISASISDALCRLATGGGFSTRKLYTNDEEAIFDAERPVMLNGIGDAITRGDLLDRAITVELAPIPDGDRLTEREIRSDFEAARPRIVGAFFDAVSAALRNLPEVKLDERPRMADFAEWVVAAEPAMPWPEGTFLKAYAENRDAAVEMALDSDPVATTIRRLIDEDDCFVGTMQELLDALSEFDQEARSFPEWPRTPRALSSRVRRAAPFLRRVGIGFRQLPRESKRRLVELWKVGRPKRVRPREPRVAQMPIMSSRRR